jgi:hypothetical protein
MTEQRVSTVEEAIDWLQDQHCPIDGSRTYQHEEVDNDGDRHYEQCDPAGHAWPLKRIGRDDFIPDPELVEEKLDEYLSSRAIERQRRRRAG